MQQVNNTIVYSGIDARFNSLRVFPPVEMKYPDLLRDKDFFERINCPHLRLKYPNAEEKKLLACDPKKMNEHEVERMKSLGLNDLVAAFEYSKRKTTFRLNKDILNKMDWNVRNMHVKDLFKYLGGIPNKLSFQERLAKGLLNQAAEKVLEDERLKKEQFDREYDVADPFDKDEDSETE